MTQYKDTTQTANTPQSANKPPIKRVIHGLLDCLLMVGMILFVLILATHCQPARATCENTSPVKQRSSISQAMPKHTAKHCISRR